MKKKAIVSLAAAAVLSLGIGNAQSTFAASKSENCGVYHYSQYQNMQQAVNNKTFKLVPFKKGFGFVGVITLNKNCITTPPVNQPEQNQPEVDNTPEQNQPEVDNTPEQNQPEVDNTPEQNQPEVDNTPEQNQPEVDNTPEQNQPEVDNTPEQNQPEVDNTPEQNQPEVDNTPEQNQPEVDNKPEQNQPAVDNTPGQNQPETENKPQEEKPSTSYEVSAYEQQVVELTNAERAKYGLQPLTLDVELSKVARIKSQDMKDKNYFDHTSPTYGSPFDMMKQFGISYKSAAENIAQGQRTPEEVVNAWMNSSGHRANILNASYTHIGIGHVSDNNYWTQMFIGK